MCEAALFFAKLSLGLVIQGNLTLPRMEDMQPTKCLSLDRFYLTLLSKESDMKATLAWSYPPFPITSTLKNVCSRTRWLGLCVTYPKADSTPTKRNQIPLRARRQYLFVRAGFRSSLSSICISESPSPDYSILYNFLEGMLRQNKVARPVLDILKC